MTEKIPTINDLLDWSNSVAERKHNGEAVPKLEYAAALAVFKYVLSVAYKQSPLQIYNILLKHIPGV